MSNRCDNCFWWRRFRHGTYHGENKVSDEWGWCELATSGMDGDPDDPSTPMVAVGQGGGGSLDTRDNHCCACWQTTGQET
jgi:hypothetical protein